MKKRWDSIYSSDFGSLWYPSEALVKFNARYLQRRIGIDNYDIKKQVERVLDIGCGNGRHLKFFAEQGLNVYGTDISEEAIEIASSWLNKEGLNADLKVGDMEHLPYDDNFFDVIISIGAIDHIHFSKAKKVMKEIQRVLSPGGYIFLALRSTEDSEFSQGEKVAYNTYILDEGHEEGIIQHYFDLEEIKELFEGL